MEEQAVLDAVAKETRQKQLLAEEKMKQLKKDREALDHEIERLQMEMKEDDVSFLLVRSSSSHSVAETRCSGTSGEPETSSPKQPSLPGLEELTDHILCFGQEARKIVIRAEFPEKLPGWFARDCTILHPTSSVRIAVFLILTDTYLAFFILTIIMGVEWYLLWF